MRRLVRAYARFRARFEWKRNIRKLDITHSGKWYIAMTIALGVTALASGNNAIYLTESLLLAGLILSGIKSEKQVSAVFVEFIRVQAKAKEPTTDWIIVRNKEKKTIFCVEIGEWKDGKFHALAYFAKIRGGETVRARSRQEIRNRGKYQWEGFAIATSYPFGFARKIKVVRQPGERIVWATPLRSKNGNTHNPVGERGHRNAEIEVVDGEVRKYDWTDDARMILANQSMRGQGPMVRNRRPILKEPEITFDARKDKGEAFESAVQKASTHFYRTENADLILIQARGKRKIPGKQAALTALALIEPEAG